MVNKEQTLEALAQEITRHSQEADVCENKADEHLLEAALLILRVRARIEEAGDTNWTQWAKQNLKIGESRLRQLQRIAKSEDPKKALQDEREKTRDRMARLRRKGKETASRDAGAGDPEPTTENSEPPRIEEAQPTESPQERGEQRDEAESVAEQLIEWAQSASPDKVQKVWQFACGLDGKPRAGQAVQDHQLSNGPSAEVAASA